MTNVLLRSNLISSCSCKEVIHGGKALLVTHHTAKAEALLAC